jgi:hypothetical protein
VKASEQQAEAIGAPEDVEARFRLAWPVCASGGGFAGLAIRTVREHRRLGVPGTGGKLSQYLASKRVVLEYSVA